MRANTIPPRAVPTTAALPVDPVLPKRAERGRERGYGDPDGTLWARNRRSDAAGAKVRLAHVDQGDLNDCFLAATLGAFALKQPTVLAEMVRWRGDHVEVRLPSGTQRVGTDLPLYRDEPAFAASGGNDVLWPAYLEKGIAATSRHGFRTLDDGGVVRDAYGLLTGRRPRMVVAPATQDLLPDIGRRLHAGEPVVVTTRSARRGSATYDAMHAVGLHGDHAYVVVAEQARDGAHLLRLWNPWGIEHPQPLDEATARQVLDSVTATSGMYELPHVRGGRRAALDGPTAPSA